mmetsp:Transcript_2141/g.4784  ORF Transcript_2141/g.4784 Transcript_2141/m.4784 type:complete len:248 (-) Transcript_2141:903-1646(-)
MLLLLSSLMIVVMMARVNTLKNKISSIDSRFDPRYVPLEHERARLLKHCSKQSRPELITHALHRQHPMRGARRHHVRVRRSHNPIHNNIPMHRVRRVQTLSKHVPLHALHNHRAALAFQHIPRADQIRARELPVGVQQMPATHRDLHGVCRGDRHKRIRRLERITVSPEIHLTKFLAPHTHAIPNLHKLHPLAFSTLQLHRCVVRKAIRSVLRLVAAAAMERKARCSNIVDERVSITFGFIRCGELL